ncbi:hypothetical protein [Marinomonas mediterranea]|uniref:Uncharacterized protein n=1 Tax=Marinomonas mediterranea (strain ATCC 700492 / JCM 21426 / NBRC 103028 / MMB-1) TaxID=717774 RepID=F2JW87_MARM1|nr:hypothetical protein [Marinomonas mediterranea]ADZ89475.1 hypothetical protein Marme_0171 [Marinomonas mediterranea MMB-1]WCN07570.1 hypothetical protein GV055_00845 [Marinomonas mediterranea]WCN15725.1 hypothetical protein GV053_00845 [Marinomonas mediterranea MMB-1]
MPKSPNTNSLLKYANAVLFVWVFVLIAPLVTPRAPVVQDNYLLVRVCSLLSGVQYVKLPLVTPSPRASVEGLGLVDQGLEDQNLENSLSAANVIDKTLSSSDLDKIHANCKCGLNVDHLLVLSTEVPFNDTIASYILLGYDDVSDAHQPFRPHLFSRAPPAHIS